MLEIKNISKYFNSNLVLKNLSFSVSEGNIFGIIGPNGAGKTTTLRIILGILPQSKGEIFFKNSPLDQNYQNDTGYLPEERGLYPKSTISNILIYLGQLKGLTYSQAVKRTDYWLDRLELKTNKKHHVEDLSKGNQQKVQFISAILHEPQILILDEPFSGFDPVNQSIFREIIEEIKDSRIIILSTHLMNLAESLCDEILLINKGEKVVSGKIDDVLNSSKQELYKIVFAEKINKDDIDKLNYLKIVRADESSITIDLNNESPNSIVNRVTAEHDIVEFKKVNPSLHNIFISLIDSAK